jgi:hypothetical protein
VCRGVPKDCFFAPTPDDCHIGACNPTTGHCDPVPGDDGVACTDKSDLCAVSKVCSGGQCLGGEPKDCSSLTAGCMQGRCDPSSGQCKAEPVPEGNPCSDAIHACNTGICDNHGACVPVPVPDGLTCEDGDACTAGETCTAGACKGGQPAVLIEYFRETFATNTAGWTLGTEWQIGPAKASPGGAGVGAEDPAVDHSLSDDNGIAGVVIGGYPSTNAHSPYFLVSPVIAVTVEGPVYLEFWRWLNADTAPYMVETVDVYDGVRWVNLWTSGGSGNHEASWTKVVYRLTPYKNPSLQVRFGFSVGNAAYVVSGWNIDDVVIANAACD